MAISGKPSALIKPTLDTKFHIDYDWWERTPGQDLRIYLLSHLSPQQRDRLSQITEARTIDYVDPDTAEVTRLDELQMAIRSAAADPGFIGGDASLVDSLFRVFLRNNNKPLSARELEEEIKRPAATILKTLTGGTIYKGIRPYT